MIDKNELIEMSKQKILGEYNQLVANVNGYRSQLAALNDPNAVEATKLIIRKNIEADIEQRKQQRQQCIAELAKYQDEKYIEVEIARAEKDNANSIASYQKMIDSWQANIDKLKSPENMAEIRKSVIMYCVGQVNRYSTTLQKLDDPLQITEEALYQKTVEKIKASIGTTTFSVENAEKRVQQFDIDAKIADMIACVEKEIQIANEMLSCLLKYKPASITKKKSRNAFTIHYRENITQPYSIPKYVSPIYIEKNWHDHTFIDVFGYNNVWLSKLFPTFSSKDQDKVLKYMPKESLGVLYKNNKDNLPEAVKTRIMTQILGGK